MTIEEANTVLRTYGRNKPTTTNKSSLVHKNNEPAVTNPTAGKLSSEPKLVSLVAKPSKDQLTIKQTGGLWK